MRYIFKSLAEAGGIAGILKFSMPLILLMYVACALIGYLCGSFNTAVFISTKFYKKDIRKFGSGNAGMTNMFRTFGKSAGIFTLIGDVVKTLIALAVSFILLGDTSQYIAGFFAIVGHVFPLYYHFKGGKGVVVSAITVLLIDPLVFLVLLVLFGLMFFATKIISAASLTAAFFYPLVVFAFHRSHPSIAYILFSLFIAVFVIVMHKDNIIRLKNGEEKKFTIGKKDGK